MPDNSPILNLPYIMPAQAQKHVTHNEAIRMLDMIVQMAVTSRTVTVPPGAPALGARYIVPAGATGVWAGQVDKVAVWGETGWFYVQPLAGWRAYVTDAAAEVTFDGTGWVALGLPTELPFLGLNATADATNRLTVAAAATLLNNAGAGHQVKVNKAGVADTASLLFQTGFSGRAEMGLAGNDDFSVKVSADGVAFATALQADAATGQVTLPQPVLLGGQAADPVSPANGTLWLNTTTGEIKARTAGTTIAVGAGGGGGGVSDGDKGDMVVSAGGAVWTVDAGAVTLAKMAGLASGTIIGRVSGGTGVPEALTAGQVRTLLGLAEVAVSGSAADLTAGVLPAGRFDDTAHGARAGGGLHAVATSSVAGFMAGADKAKLDGVAAGAEVNVPTDLSYAAGSRVLASSTGADVTLPLADGVNAGLMGAADFTKLGGIAAGANAYVHPNHSGDVTSVADGATVIAPNAVTNAKAADMPTGTLKGRVSAGTGDPEDLTVAQAKAMLNLTGTNSGDQTITLTGDVTGSGTGSFAATVAADAVTNAKLANMAAGTIKGAVTAGDPADLSAGQVRGILNVADGAR